MHKIQLVNSRSIPNDVLTDKWYTPLNLIWIANYIEANGITTQILDGVSSNFEEMLDKLDAPIVGVNFNYLSIENLDKLLKVAKNKGSFTVVGGQAATFLAKQLLQNNMDIDAVVIGDGEEAMLQLAIRANKGIPSFEGIPNLAYRNGDDIVFSTQKQMDLTKLPFPDRRVAGLEMDEYISKYYESNTDPAMDNVRVTNAYMKKGCLRRVADKGCSFCARIDRGLRSKTALQAYDEYSYLVKEFKIDYIYDDSDSWVDGPWMRSLANIYQQRGEVKAKLRVYADVRDITEDNVSIMKDLNVDTVLVGVESGDEHILRRNGKPMTKEMIVKAAKLLGHAGIKMCDAYVLGLIGETRTSVNATTSLAQQLSNYCEKRITYWNVMMPLPGSPVWREMMQISMLRDKYGDKYKFDVEEVQKDYVDCFCHLGSDGYEYLKNTSERLQADQNIPLRKYIR
jgi:radical SAM superfamily enzyme YgiQ (UPF0313 family)